MDDNSPDRPPLELTKYPILQRVVAHQAATNWTHRFSNMGEVLEGFEIWLPYLIPVYQSSMIEVRAEVRIDTAPVDVEFMVARYRRKYGHDG